jgi:lsr operon transcriptional repressor
VLDIDHNHRVIAHEPQALRNIEHVIAVAGGEAEVGAIRAALRGGYVKTLVTDGTTAKEVLARRQEWWASQSGGP